MPKDSTEVILAFDYGERRIGVAVGQDITNSASPLGTLKNSKLGVDWAQIKQWIEEWQPNLLVVGLPLSENNVTSDIQNYIKSFVKQLSKFNLPINMIDESYSSKEANEMLILERRLGLRGKIKKEMVDAAAATLIAERWLKIK